MRFNTRYRIQVAHINNPKFAFRSIIVTSLACLCHINIRTEVRTLREYSSQLAMVPQDPFSSPGQAGHEYSVRFTESTRNSRHFCVINEYSLSFTDSTHSSKQFCMINHVNKWNFQSSFKAKCSFGLKSNNTFKSPNVLPTELETKTRARKMFSLFEVQWRNHERKIHYMTQVWPLLKRYSKILCQSRIVILWHIH